MLACQIAANSSQKQLRLPLCLRAGAEILSTLAWTGPVQKLKAFTANRKALHW